MGHKGMLGARPGGALHIEDPHHAPAVVHVPDLHHGRPSGCAPVLCLWGLGRNADNSSVASMSHHRRTQIALLLQANVQQGLAFYATVVTWSGRRSHSGVGTCMVSYRLAGLRTGMLQHE